MDLVDAILSQATGQNPQASPDAVDSILDAASNMKLDADPAYQSMQLHVAAMQANGHDVPDSQKLAILQAYKEVYHQQPMEQAGGNSILDANLQAQASQNSAAGNFLRAGANAAAQTGADVLGVVAPGTANALATQAQQEYNPDLSSFSGKAGELAGGVVSSLPAVLTPGAAVPAFAGLGFGQANREVSQENANGADIGVARRLTYDTTNAAIQGLVAHFLGKMTGGGLAQDVAGGGEVTQTIPLQNLIRRMSPDLLNSIQGTDGAVIRPIVQRTLLQMGVGAGQNEAAMIAQQIARSVEGIAQPQEKDLVDRILDATPGALVGGAAQALPFALHGELATRDLTTGPVEQVPQENVEQPGTAANMPRNIRYASESPFPNEPQTPEEQANVANFIAKTQGQFGGEESAPTAEFPASLSRPITEADYTAAEDESDRDMPHGTMLPPEGNTTLPAESLPEVSETHPLADMLKSVNPSVKQVEVRGDLKDDLSALKKQGITPVTVIGDNVPPGFTSSLHPDAAVIDVSNPGKSFWNVMAHEAGHIWFDANPNKVDRIYRLIPDALKKQYQDWYFNAYAKRFGAEAAQEYMAKNKKTETISLAFGSAAENDSMVQRAFKKDTSLWGSIKDAFSRTLNRFSGKGRLLNAIADEMRDGLGVPPSAENGGFDETRARKIAAAYDQLKHTPDEPAVQRSYAAFKDETLQQFKDLQAQGYTMEPWEGKGQPYKNSREMAADVNDNKHLSFFTGGDLPEDHPLATQTGLQSNGHDLTYNNVFRAVHDVYGHAKPGNSFSAKGEEAAWEAHSKMYSKEAQPAMTTETRGQNSWVNYGPHGEENRANPANTRYAEQKAGILPKEFHPTESVYTPRESPEVSGRYMLPKLANIAKNDEDVQDYKDAVNAASPRNAVKFRATAEDKFKRQVFDSMAPVVSMIRSAMGRVNDPSVLSPEIFLRRGAGFAQRRIYQERLGLRGPRGEEVVDRKTGQNLTRNWLIDPIAKGVKSSGEKAEDVAAFYHSVMVSQRTLEKAKNTILSGGDLTRAISGENRLSAGQGLAGEKDLDAAVDFLRDAQKNPLFDNALEYARRYRLWENEHGYMAVEAGLLSTKQWSAIQSQNQFHVNMQRVMEDSGVLGKEDFADGSYRKFQGSNRLIDNPLSNMLQTTEQVARKAEQNFVKQRIVEIAKPFGDLIQPAKKAASDTISVLEGGVEKFYHVDPQVASALNGWGQHAPAALWGIPSLLGRMKLVGTLMRPMFQWNHFRKQLQNRILISQEAGGFKGLIDTFKGFDPATKEVLDALGGTMGHEKDFAAGQDKYNTIVRKTMMAIDKSGDKNTLLALPGKVWKGYQKISEWSDAFNRVVEFKAAYQNAKRNGMNDLDAQTYAAGKARDLMDFSIAGEAVRGINRICYQPFLNAEMQGLHKIYDLARTKPGLAAARLGLFGLVPAMIPYLWAKSQGKDTESLYRDTPMAQRIMFYNFHMGNYRIMVPKGQTQAMASAMWEAFLDKHRGDPATWLKAMGQSGLIPRQATDPESLLPLQGVREAISNYSWFYDRNIVPPDQNGLALDLRHTDGASGLAQQISKVAKKAGWELDPRKIDHVLSSDLGTGVQDIQTVSNLPSASKPLAKNALSAYGDVRMTPGYTSVSVQDAMKAATRFQDTESPQYKAMADALQKSYSAKTVEDRNALVNQARTAADDATAFYQEHGDQLIQAKVASQRIEQADATYKALQGIGARQQWATANPQQLALVKNAGRLGPVQTRISELRKLMTNPKVSENTKTMADREITRLYGVIVTLGQNTTSQE